MVRGSLIALTLAFGLSAGASPPALAQAPGQPADRVSGTWDLTWQTRKGPQRKGWFVIVQQGSKLKGEIHGQGHVKASGEARGSSFVLRGTRMMVPYTIAGTVEGDRMQGSLKVLSVDRKFTGARRR